MSTEIKLCKDCRFFDGKAVNGPTCLHQAAINFDLVTGDQSHWRCQAMRLSPRCDTEGKLWEAKEQP